MARRSNRGGGAAPICENQEGNSRVIALVAYTNQQVALEAQYATAR